MFTAHFCEKKQLPVAACEKYQTGLTHAPCISCVRNRAVKVRLGAIKTACIEKSMSGCHKGALLVSTTHDIHVPCCFQVTVRVMDVNDHHPLCYPGTYEAVEQCVSV